MSAVRPNRRIFAGVGAATLIVALLLTAVDGGQDKVRYQQHLEQPSEAALGPRPETEGLVTHLPILSIDTGGTDIPHLDHSGALIDDETGARTIPSEEIAAEVDAVVGVRDAENAWHTEQDAPSAVVQGQVRIRGNSSRNFDKKSYLLRLDEKSGLLGMSAAGEWVLNGPFLDRTLVRNYLCYTTAGQIMAYAPNCRFCEVTLNGEYCGVYLLVEAVAREEGRLPLTKPEKGRDLTSWLVRWDRAGKGDTPLDNFAYYTLRGGVSGLDLRYPGKSQITEGRRAFAEAEISAIEHRLYAAQTAHGDNDVFDAIDVTAFAQYFVINEFFSNVDAGRFSTFYYKDIRGKVTPCVWDFNNACDNYIDYVYGDSGFSMQNAPWFDALLRNERFVNEVIHQYRTLRRGPLSDEALTGLIDGTVDYLGSAIDRNYAVFGYVFAPTQADGIRYLTPLARNDLTYEGAVERLETWLTDRGAWLDRHIDSLRQYCQPSRNAGSALY